MEFEITFEEIYSDEIALTKQIIDIVKVNKNKLFFNTFVFGARYKAYLNNDNKYVVCSCEKKSIENRIKLYKQQFELNGEWKYYDYVYDKHIDNPSLEYFLGLPKELNIDYSKDIVSQITFEDKICHRCCGVDYQYLIQQEHSKKQVDKRRDLEKENYFISKGFHYTPIYKQSYILIDELCNEEMLLLLNIYFTITLFMTTRKLKEILRLNLTEMNKQVKLFFKIPDKFKIPTPIGNYNPDWAVYVENENEKKLYFVIETKGSTSFMDLRDKESIKIQCDKKHFQAIGADVCFNVTKTFRDFKEKHC